MNDYLFMKEKISNTIIKIATVYITIMTVFDFPVLPLNVCPQDSHLVTLTIAGPSAPPHHVHLTLLIKALLHFGQFVIIILPY